MFLLIYLYLCLTILRSTVGFHISHTFARSSSLRSSYLGDFGNMEGGDVENGTNDRAFIRRKGKPVDNRDSLPYTVYLVEPGKRREASTLYKKELGTFYLDPTTGILAFRLHPTSFSLTTFPLSCNNSKVVVTF